MIFIGFLFGGNILFKYFVEFGVLFDWLDLVLVVVLLVDFVECV